MIYTPPDARQNMARMIPEIPAATAAAAHLQRGARALERVEQLGLLRYLLLALEQLALRGGGEGVRALGCRGQPRRLLRLLVGGEGEAVALGVERAHLRGRSWGDQRGDQREIMARSEQSPGKLSGEGGREVTRGTLVHPGPGVGEPPRPLLLLPE